MDSKHSAIEIKAVTLANRITVIAVTIISSIIGVAYLAEAVKHNRTWAYVLSVFGIALVLIIASWISYIVKPSSRVVRFIASVGYGFLYAYVLYTGINDLVFTYAFPVFVVITLYNDLKYILTIGIGLVIVNIGYVVVRIIGGGVTAHDITTFEIQILLSILFGIYMVLVVNINRRINGMKAAAINEENEHISRLLDKIIKVSGNMSDDVINVSGQMKNLEESVERTLYAMEEVKNGTNETAYAIQEQLYKTEEIQNNVDSVKQAVSIISEKMETTTEAIKNGQSHIKALNNFTEVSDEASACLALVSIRLSIVSTITLSCLVMSPISCVISSVADVV